MIRIFLVYLNRGLFLCLGCKLGRPILVLNGIFGTDDILAVRAQNFLCGGDIEIRRYLNKGVGRLFRRVELLLPWLRLLRCVCLLRSRFLLPALRVEAGTRKRL